jgi:hypothetical protein
VLTGISSVFLVLFMASCVLLALAAGRAARGALVFGLDTPQTAARVLLGQLALLALSLPAVYGVVGGQFMPSMVILFVIFVLGVPLLCATYYYVSVFGGWLARGIYTPEAGLPGTELPELDRAMALRQRGEVDAAAELAGSFLVDHPKNIPALRFMADLELRRGRPGRAAGLCRRALVADLEIRATRTGLVEEERVSLISLLAEGLEADGRPDEAAQALEEELASLSSERSRELLAERAARLRPAGTVGPAVRRSRAQQ